MPRIDTFDVHAVELPFRSPFRHAAAVRSTSSSLFIRCRLDDGTCGWGESLPREYVTGESRDQALELLRNRVLPRLVGQSFDGLVAVREFLTDCDGKAPSEWVPADVPQTAAWCAVDLALLDAFGRSTEQPALAEGRRDIRPGLRYSGVVSADRGWRVLKRTVPMRLFGLRSFKIKVERETSVHDLRPILASLGPRADLRADANMAWTVEEALKRMPAMARRGIRSFEQPLPADDLDGLARLVHETGLEVMADESFSDRASLDTLIARRACTAVNLRIAKCGGLMASLARAREALAAGLTVQVGCQVGESSLLSAAHLALLAAVPDVKWAEGCFGKLLLREDPAAPLLQFGFGGRPPAHPSGSGLGPVIDQKILARHTVARREVSK